MKTCTKCLKSFELNQFRKDSSTPDGLERRCGDCARARGRENYAAHRSHYIQYSHEYARENKDAIRQTKRKYQQNRRKTNPQVRVLRNLQSRIYTAICDTGGRKSARTIELVGCPVVWLEVHLESMFKPGMTRENYGPVWHIDHVKPC